MELLYVKKSSKRSQYEFKKEEGVLDSLMKILEILGFNESPEQNLKDVIYESEGCVELNDLIDNVYGLVNDIYFAEVFFGTEKVILVLISEDDMQKEISEAVFKFADFKENEN